MTINEVAPAERAGDALGAWLYGTQRVIWALGALALNLFCPQAIAVEPAQVPLTNQVSPPPKPSVMLTVDDSLSMRADSIPDGNFAVNGQSLALSPVGSGIAAFPFDTTKQHSATVWSSNYFVGVVISDPGVQNVFQMQFRSPDVNSIYYNPDIRYLPWLKSDGSGVRLGDIDPRKAPYDVSNAVSTIDLTKNILAATGQWCTDSGVCAQATRDFYPGRYYRLIPNSDPRNTSSYQTFDINGPDYGGPPASASLKHPNRTDCAGATCSQAEERANFANWFGYYRERLDLNKAAISETFANYKGRMRLGWASINYSGPDGVVREPIRDLDAPQLARLLGGVQGMTNATFTPLRKAVASVGEYFKRTDALDPWLNTIGDTTSGRSACRRAVNVLMSDGYYNDTLSASESKGNVDAVDGAAMANNPNRNTPNRYISSTPFSDAYSDTLADIAMAYYVADLSAAANNELSPRTNDAAFWQHLTQFTIGLGVKGTLDASTPATKLSTLRALASGATNWPDPTCANCAEEKVDDMWHAAVNTGGDFFAANNVEQLVNAFDTAFAESIVDPATEAGVAASSTSLAAGNIKFVPSYRSVSWTGDLVAWELDAQGAVATPTNPKWRASDKVLPWGVRRLFTWSGSSGVRFRWGDIGAANQSLIGTESLTNYIRGDTSNEGVTFRRRGGKLLGDFINSTPLYVQNLISLPYGGMSGYNAYAQAKSARSRGVVFQGGNEGILHGFDADSGIEVFGYVPQGALHHFAQISSSSYGTATNFHRFLVDGPILESDAVLGGTWENVVVGAMGAGGKGLFGLKVPVSNPTSMSEQSVLWDLTANTDPDLGYVVSDFAVGKVRDGGWKVFVGNGAHSDSGRAVLLVIDLASGAVDRVVSDNGSGNGLMGVSVVRDPMTQEVVAAYAGDLKGALWRFDFEAGGTTANWKVGFSGQPLFEATSPSGARQPISAPPAFVTHANGGQMVLFGTGRLLDLADPSDQTLQTFYGVWDDTPIGSSSANLVSPFAGYTVGRSGLHAQIANLSTSVSQSGDVANFFSVTTTPVDWTNEHGWYVDLPIAGQRVIYPTTVIANDFVFISSIVPVPNAIDCQSRSGIGYNFLLDARQGQQMVEPVFDTDGNGVIDSGDTVGSVYQAESDGRDVVMLNVADPRSGSIASSTVAPMGFKVPCVSNCRRKVKDRVWRQIFNPPTP